MPEEVSVVRRLKLALFAVGLVIAAKSLLVILAWMDAHERLIRVGSAVALAAMLCGAIWCFVSLRGPRYISKNGQQEQLPFWQWLLGRGDQ